MTKETEQPVLGPGVTGTVSKAVPEFSHPQLGILPAAQFRQDRLHGIEQGQKRQRGFLDPLGPFDLAVIQFCHDRYKELSNSLHLVEI